MSSQVIYQQLKKIRECKASQLLKPVAMIEPTFSISKAIGMMLETDSYDVFCMKGKEVLTTNARELLSTRDVAGMISILLHRIQPLTKNDTVEKAATIMSHYRMRSVPIVDDGQIIGSVSGKNIVQLLNQENLRWIPANNILTPNPITINSSEHLATARRIMISKRIDHLPVIRAGKISQVLTSMHLLQALKPGERIGSDLRGLNMLRRLESPISNLGSTRVPNCTTNSSLSTVVDSMLKSDTTCCLLTLWDNLHGIITYKDLLNLLESKILSEVPLYIVGLPEDLSNSEIVKTKFQKIIRNLIKVYPEVEEAKASIKTIHNPTSNRQHYEATVRVLTPYKTYSYTELGWDLSKIFDILGSKIIRNLSQRSKRRWKTSIRKIDKKEIF